VNRSLLLVFLVVAGCSGASQRATNAPLERTGDANQIACRPRGCDPHKIGVVVLPAGHTFDARDTHLREWRPGTSIARLELVLRGAGFRVVLPEMPWSTTHPYDRSFEEALDAVAAAVGKLRAQGAERVVVVGHSLGGGAVIGFGALRGGVDGIVALAAGPDPASLDQERDRAASVAKAEAMLAAGRANEMAAFTDINMQYQGTVWTTPAHYLSLPRGRNVAASQPRGLATRAAATMDRWKRRGAASEARAHGPQPIPARAADTVPGRVGRAYGGCGCRRRYRRRLDQVPLRSRNTQPSGEPQTSACPPTPSPE
jgi:pimeloyl-ACP methyl ester carboxylesterase